MLHAKSPACSSVSPAPMPASAAKAEAAIVPPLVYDLDQLRNSLAPQPVTIKTLPPSLIRDWVLPDGRARVEALPKGDRQ